MRVLPERYARGGTERRPRGYSGPITWSARRESAAGDGVRATAGFGEPRDGRIRDTGPDRSRGPSMAKIALADAQPREQGQRPQPRLSVPDRERESRSLARCARCDRGRARCAARLAAGIRPFSTASRTSATRSAASSSSTRGTATATPVRRAADRRPVSASGARVEQPPPVGWTPASVRRERMDRPSAAVESALAALGRRVSGDALGLAQQFLDRQPIQRGALDPDGRRLDIDAAAVLGERACRTPPISAEVSIDSDVEQAYSERLLTTCTALHADVAPGRLREVDVVRRRTILIHDPSCQIKSALQP